MSGRYSKTDDYHYQLSVDSRRLTGELIIGGDDLVLGDIVDVYGAPAHDWHELALFCASGRLPGFSAIARPVG